MTPHPIERQQRLQTYGHRRIAEGTKEGGFGPSAESSERGGGNAPRMRVGVTPEGGDELRESFWSEACDPLLGAALGLGRMATQLIQDAPH